MSNFTSSAPAPASSSSAQGSTSPLIINIPLPDANTEESYTFLAATKRFRIQLRGSATLKVAFTSGDSGTTFLTIYPGDCFEESDLGLLAGLTLYFQSSKPAEVLEILSWT